MRLYIGVDPGASSGGWATITEDRQVQMGKWEDLAETWKALEAAITPPLGGMVILQAMIEDVHAFPGQGVQSAFHFGMNYGQWQAILFGLHIPFERVSPIRWQTALRCRSHGDKRVTRLKARELFPQIAKQIGHATADALLIAEYCLRTHECGKSAYDPIQRTL